MRVEVGCYDGSSQASCKLADESLAETEYRLAIAGIREVDGVALPAGQDIDLENERAGPQVFDETLQELGIDP